MSTSADDVVVRDNPEAGRFEAQVGGHTAICEYLVTPEGMRFIHTVVPEALSGRGIGSKLAEAGMQACRDRGLQVLPDCSFIAGYMRKHPECQDLLHPSYRDAMGL
jgi:predicted GNAT family acetyltransferase